MKFKKVFINIVLTISSIYIPLFTFSTFDYFLYYVNKESRHTSKELKKSIISAVNDGYLPVFHPNEHFKKEKIPEIYPIGALTNTKNYFCDEGYGLIRYKSDSFGLRNTNKKWENVSKKSNIFLVGDSFVHGACLPDDKLISTYIESSTNQNTLSLGMAGNSPYEYMAILKSLVKPIINNSNNSNKVILIFYDNDNLPLNEKKEKLLSSIKSIIKKPIKNNPSPTINYKNYINSYIKNNYPYSKNEIINRVKAKRTNFNKKQFLYRVASLFPIRRRIGLTGINSLFLSSKLSKNSPSLNSILLLSEICKQKCDPYIAYIPSSSYWDPHPYGEKYKNELEKISAKFGIPFINGEKVIKSNNLKDYAPNGAHLSIDGYKKLADLISKEIK
tara:strand:- start:1129 stop:2292 length:1164 start_codon:yes stop_codon:yes gene_type:complete